MTVRASAARIKILNKFMAYFPGANRLEPFNANRMKHILFNIMPIHFQRAFGQSAQRLDSDVYTYDHLIEYMVQQETYEQADARSRVISNIGNNRRSATTAFGFQDNNFRPTQRRRMNPNPAPQEPCPYHGHAHIWKFCFGNKNGPNYRADYTLPALPFSQGAIGNHGGSDNHYNNGRPAFNIGRSPSSTPRSNRGSPARRGTPSSRPFIGPGRGNSNDRSRNVRGPHRSSPPGRYQRTPPTLPTASDTHYQEEEDTYAYHHYGETPEDNQVNDTYEYDDYQQDEPPQDQYHCDEEQQQQPPSEEPEDHHWTDDVQW
jgi:hypothetical protein